MSAPAHSDPLMAVKVDWAENAICNNSERVALRGLSRLVVGPNRLALEERRQALPQLPLGETVHRHSKVCSKNHAPARTGGLPRNIRANRKR